MTEQIILQGGKAESSSVPKAQVGFGGYAEFLLASGTLKEKHNGTVRNLYVYLLKHCLHFIKKKTVWGNYGMLI